MSQQNIDFGAFPDDPSADAIRTGFQKTQDNFNQLFSAVGTSAVLSVNRTAGVGITVNSPTGNVVVSANIASVRFSSSQLRFGLTPAPTTTTATYTDYAQTMYVELPANISLGNLSVTGTSNLGPASNVIITGGTAGYVLSTNGSGTLSWAAPGGGVVGATGPTGATGPAGATGVTGATGPSGSNILRIVVSATDYTPVLGDAYNTLVRMTKSTPTNFILPNDSDVNMPIGTAILIGWDGDGQVTVAPAVGVTCNTPDTLTIAKKWGKIVVFKISANYWQVEGNLTPGA
jgi:hypothetical protein